MAKQHEIKLTKSEIDHLLNLIAMNHIEECYSGNSDQYWKRSERIRSKLNRAGRSGIILTPENAEIFTKAC